MGDDGRRRKLLEFDYYDQYIIQGKHKPFGENHKENSLCLIGSKDFSQVFVGSSLLCCRVLILGGGGPGLY